MLQPALSQYFNLNIKYDEMQFNSRQSRLYFRPYNQDFTFSDLFLKFLLSISATWLLDWQTDIDLVIGVIGGTSTAL